MNWTLRPRTRTRRADAHALARRCADDARHAAMFSGKNAADGKVRPAGRAHRARSIAFSDAVTSPRSATSSASSSSSFRRRFLLPLVQKGRLVRRSTRVAMPRTLTVSLPGSPHRSALLRTQPMDAKDLLKKLRQKQEELDMLQIANEALQAQSRMSNERADAMESLTGDKEMALAQTRSALDETASKLLEAERVAKDAVAVVEAAAESEARAVDKTASLEAELRVALESSAAKEKEQRAENQKTSDALADVTRRLETSARRVDELEARVGDGAAEAAAAARAADAASGTIASLRAANEALEADMRELQAEYEREGAVETSSKKGKKANPAKELAQARRALKKAQEASAEASQRERRLEDEKRELEAAASNAKQQTELIREAEEKAAAEAAALTARVRTLEGDLRAAAAEAAAAAAAAAEARPRRGKNYAAESKSIDAKGDASPPGGDWSRSRHRPHPAPRLLACWEALRATAPTPTTPGQDARDPRSVRSPTWRRHRQCPEVAHAHRPRGAVSHGCAPLVLVLVGGWVC